MNGDEGAGRRAAGLRIGLVAGEISGDRLGAALIGALRDRGVLAGASGMAGDAMIEAGCTPIAHVAELSVMGLVEVLAAYPRLHALRGRLIEHFVETRPDVVIGIDVPDFNLGLARRLRGFGITTVQWVCPQAWAWRAGRAGRLRHSVDLLLALFPFEAEFFAAHGVATEFVGHPLADTLPLAPDRAAARRAFGWSADELVVALLPGSRAQELAHLLEPFTAAARLIAGRRPQARFVLCAARSEHAGAARTALGDLRGEVVLGQTHQALTAADVALVASGTATLEALLCVTPMVVGYRMASLSYHIIRRMVNIPRIALPNILAGRELVPELLQDALTPTALAAAALAWLDDPVRCAEFARVARQVHAALRCAAAARAADAIVRVAAQRP